jgi:hypothetical protein
MSTTANGALPSPSPTGSAGPTDDTGLLSRLEKDAAVIRKELGPYPTDLVSSFDPTGDPQRTSKPAKGTESAEDKKLDQLRGAMCSEMTTFYSARPWNDLCGNRVLSEAYAFGQATTGAGDLEPFCGVEAARTCSQGMGTAAQGNGGTTGSAEAIMDCDLVSWRTACLEGSSAFDANPKDPGFNQRLFGRVPIDCYCACYDQCTMGQSSVLGAQQQRTGATCTPGQLRAGKCREHS